MGEPRRFFNPSQPQTLQIGVWLLYFNAVWALIFAFGVYGPLLWAVLVGALGAGAFGIANEQRWGYVLGVAGAVLNLLVLLWRAQGDVFGFPYVITLIFDIGLVVALVHPQSREYQRIWFS